MQHDKRLDQIRVIDAMMLEECDIDEFAGQVIDFCEENYKPTKDRNGTTIPIRYRDFCDHSGTHERDTGNLVKILRRRHGIRPKSRFSKPEERVKLIRTRLRVNSHGVPGLVVRRGVVLITEGFRGSYTSKPDVLGNPTGVPFPDGIYIHSLDGLGYPLDNLFGVPRDPAKVAAQKRRAWRQRKDLNQRYAKSVSGYSE